MAGDRADASQLMPHPPDVGQRAASANALWTSSAVVPCAAGYLGRRAGKANTLPPMTPVVVLDANALHGKKPFTRADTVVLLAHHGGTHQARHPGRRAARARPAVGGLHRRRQGKHRLGVKTIDAVLGELSEVGASVLALRARRIGQIGEPRRRGRCDAELVRVILASCHRNLISSSRTGGILIPRCSGRSSNSLAMTTLDRLERTFMRSEALRGKPRDRRAGAMVLALFASGLLVVLPGQGPADAVVPAGNRLVPDASFEDGAAGSTPPEWTASGGGSATTTQSGPRSGTAALALTVPAGGAAETASSAALAVVPGEVVDVTVWADHRAGAVGSAVLEFRRADGALVAKGAGSFSAAGPSSAGWQDVSVEAVAPDEATTATIKLIQPAAGTTVWDDVTMNTSPASTYQLPEAGFEDTRDDAGRSPQFWDLSGAALRVATSSNVWSGDQSLRLLDQDTSTSAHAVSRRIPVAGASSLVVSAWAKRNAVTGDSATIGTMTVRFYANETGGSALATSPGYAGPSTSWHKVTVNAAVPSGAYYVDVDINSTAANIGWSYWDDLRIQASNAPAYVPTVQAGVHGATDPAGTVLLVGDERVDTAAGLSRVVHPGTKVDDDPTPPATSDGVILDWTDPDHGGASVSVKAIASTQENGIWKLWTSSGWGDKLATSTDGVNWSSFADSADVTITTPTGTTVCAFNSAGACVPFGPSAVVRNPSATNGLPKYVGLVSLDWKKPTTTYYFCGPIASGCEDQDYFVVGSSNGVSWSFINNGAPVLDGFDVAKLAWDPKLQQFRATLKKWTYTSGAYAWQPRSAWTATSADLVTWTRPRYAFGSDVLDMRAVAASQGSGATSDVYALPLTQYGDQYIATPWMFDIRDPYVSGTGQLPGMNNDIGVSHIEIASSRNGITWSRPDREVLVPKGADGQWDWGFGQTANNLELTATETRLYDSSYKGEHNCHGGDDPTIGTRCAQAHAQTPTRVGMVKWERDRMVSLRGEDSGGTLVTRPLAPPSVAGLRLDVNAAPLTDQTATFRVDLLDEQGNLIAQSDTWQAGSLAHTVQWGPNGVAVPMTPGQTVRLRISVVNGDLYGFRFVLP